MPAGPDEVRGSGLNQSIAVIAACWMARCPKSPVRPVGITLSDHPCKARLNVRIVGLLEFRIMPFRSRAFPKLENFSSFVITAHAMRAVLLAIATVTKRAG